MDRNNIFIEALYGFKCARRTILFGIFILLSIAGLVIYLYLPLPGMNNAHSMDDTLHFSMDWMSQALPSLIAYKTAYYFNIIQLFFVIVFIANDSRGSKLRAIESLHARPQNNSEIVTGNFIGKLFIFTLVNSLVFAISILINIVFYPHTFAFPAYLFYWITLTCPALFYFLGISYFVTRLVRNQGLSTMILFLFLGYIIYWGAGWFNGLFDPCARYVPNLFSDFMGHVNLSNYLLQRGFILLVGIGFLSLSTISYPRIPNHMLAFKRSLSVASVVFILAGGLAFTYYTRHRTISDNRTISRRVYEEHGKLLPARVTRNDLYIKELENGNITGNSRMTVMNRTSAIIPLVIYLNPGLKVNSIEIDGKNASLKRNHQALLVDKELYPGETSEVTIDYEGNIENDICFLDVAPEIYNSPAVNNIGIYHFGYSPAFCEKGYKLFTPECIWYPVCVPPYGDSGIRDMNFTRYSLKVEHDPRLSAISQGNMINIGKGETSFTFNHDMPGISLCIGNYEKREITVDSTRLTLYYLTGHDYLLPDYDIPEEKLVRELAHIKERDFESRECIQTTVFKRNDLRRKNVAYDPTQKYPYRWFTLLEVPCNFHCFPGIMQLSGERVQGGIAFIPERAYSIKNYPSKAPLDIKTDKEASAIFRLEEDINMIVSKGNCNIRPMFRGKTMSISSRECPIIHDVFTHVARKGFNSLTATPVEDYPALEYLNRKSLKEALSDHSLSPEILERIIRKKSQELHAYLSLWVGEEQFCQFYVDFLKNNLFKETTLDECYRQFHQTFGFRLDSLVRNWYTTDRLPSFKIRDARVFKITETDTPYKLYCLKVFNNSDVPGLIMTDDHQGWIIPPREGREIRTRNKKRDPEFIYGCSMKMPLAQNLPAIIELELEKPTYAYPDTTTGVFSIDSSLFLPNKEEIIVDNEDPGFKVVKAKKIISSLFREEKSSEERYELFVLDSWHSTIHKDFYGTPVRSAFCKVADAGKQKVEWNASLPQEGKYEVFFYYVERFISQSIENSHYYTIFDKKGEHEVVATLNKAEIGSWVSLGIFDFSKDAKVTLSDRGRTENDVQSLVADAVKWVKVKE